MTGGVDMNSIRDSIAAYIVGSVGSDICDDDDIFELGLVSSLFAVQLVDFVEGAFQIAVENDDLELGNFRSVSALSEFVASKLGLLGR